MSSTVAPSRLLEAGRNFCCVLCAGFRTPGMMRHSHALAAGVRNSRRVRCASVVLAHRGACPGYSINAGQELLTSLRGDLTRGGGVRSHVTIPSRCALPRGASCAPRCGDRCGPRQASTSSSSRRTAGPAGFLIQRYGDRLHATEPTRRRVLARKTAAPVQLICPCVVGRKDLMTKFYPAAVGDTTRHRGQTKSAS